MKFLLRAAEGLTQAEGRKEPKSAAAMAGAAMTCLVGVVGAGDGFDADREVGSSLSGTFLFSDSSFPVSLLGSSSITSLVPLLGSSFRVLLLGGPSSSSLSARPLLLVVLIRPGGGEEDGLPSKGESWRGGRTASET